MRYTKKENTQHIWCEILMTFLLKEVTEANFKHMAWKINFIRFKQYDGITYRCPNVNSTFISLLFK